MASVIASYYSAGVWEQNRGFVEWSRHRTPAAARKAAARYAKACRPSTGGALSWSGGVRGPSGVTTWFDARGARVGETVDDVIAAR